MNVVEEEGQAKAVLIPWPRRVREAPAPRQEATTRRQWPRAAISCGTATVSVAGSTALSGVVLPPDQASDCLHGVPAEHSLADAKKEPGLESAPRHDGPSNMVDTRVGIDDFENPSAATTLMGSTVADWADEGSDPGHRDTSTDVTEESGLEAGSVLLRRFPPGKFRSQGKVKSFSQNKGYGFIDCKEAQRMYLQDVFLHFKQRCDLEVGEEVSFVIETNKLGMPQARDVRRVFELQDHRALQQTEIEAVKVSVQEEVLSKRDQEMFEFKDREARTKAVVDKIMASGMTSGLRADLCGIRAEM